MEVALHTFSMHQYYGHLSVGITVEMVQLPLFPPVLPIFAIPLDVCFDLRCPISKVLFGRYAWPSLYFSLYSMFHTIASHVLV